jgi:hypothetical protein
MRKEPKNIKWDNNCKLKNVVLFFVYCGWRSRVLIRKFLFQGIPFLSPMNWRLIGGKQLCPISFYWMRTKGIKMCLSKAAISVFQFFLLLSCEKEEEGIDGRNSKVP